MGQKNNKNQKYVWRSITEEKLRQKGFIQIGTSWVSRNDYLEEWIKKENIKNMNILDKRRSIELRKKFVKSFLKRGSEKDWDLSMYWGVFNNDFEIFSELIDFRKSINVVSRLIGTFNFPPYHELFLMISVTDDIRIAVFQYKDLNYIFGETGFGDFYIFDKSFRWAICINHHDYVIFLDKQKQHIKKKRKTEE